MWSVSARRREVSIYLCRAFALVQERNAPTIVQPLPELRGLKDTLGNLDRWIPSRANLTIHLSAGYCPAVLIEYPAGIYRFSERRAFAAAAAAKQMRVPAASLMCELDPSSPSMCAVIPTNIHQHLATWAGESGSRLRRLRPLWSLASEGAIARKAIAGVSLKEADSVTTWVKSDDGRTLGFSMPLEPAVSRLTVDQKIEGMIRSLGVMPFDIAPLQFVDTRSSDMHEMPEAWRGHWVAP